MADKKIQQVNHTTQTTQFKAVNYFFVVLLYGAASCEHAHPRVV